MTTFHELLHLHSPYFSMFSFESNKTSSKKQEGRPQGNMTLIKSELATELISEQRTTEHTQICTNA